ncbi:MFS transporter [Micromonospora endolithica]|uniref:MFS transporter n=1 Tax=Micromonospora endolithica TaxID=230091 RepID=A0A3A9YV62_9ACTN|nr:MFS transporter [Micromonospora endolithica]RKN39659.1 MFS transporter [Micromonospora endolithica]TWJ22197.1 putative MFS family arabinose efflux permease [Micromonospora endolithica]
MTLTSVRPPDRRVRRLAATLYGYAFLSELVLLYPVYALLFSDTGLTVWQISTLFVIWSASSVLLEVPSGALADAVSRRLLICLAPLVTGAGFALWVLAPSYPAFALGFLLWGAGGALASGALEALVFDELDQLGAAGRYARTVGRAETAGTVAVLLSIVLAGPVLALGGYLAVGAASVATCVAAAALATRFPEHRRPAVTTPTGPAGDSDDPDDDLGWWASLRAGLAEVRLDRGVRAAVLLVAAVSGVWGVLDEYTPLLARDTGVAEPTVPLLLLLTWIGVSVGGLLAPAGERWGRRGYAVLLVASAVALAAGALLGHPAGFVLIGAAFCGFQLATVLAGARLQARIRGASRATVTSLSGMATDVTVIALYAGYGLLATGAGNAVAFAVAAVPYLLVAVLVVRRAGTGSRRATRSAE